MARVAAMKKRHGALLTMLVLALAGAGYFAWRYMHRVQPDPPPRGASMKSAPAFERESSLNVPIAVDVDLIGRIADARVPRDLLSRSGVDVGADVTADIVIRRTGHITAEARHGKLHLRTPVTADIAAEWRPKGLVGLLSRSKRQKVQTRATFVVRAEISLGTDAQWNLATSTEATLRWEEDPIVQIGPLGVQLSALVGDRIDERFDDVVRTLDERLRSQVPLRPLITRAWEAAFRSLPIGETGDLWLALRPTGAFLGDIQARDGKVFLDAGIRGVFHVVVGKQPEAVEPTPLPVRSAPPIGPGMALDLPVSITFEAANRQLDERVEGQILDVPLDVLGRSFPLTIEAIEVYPSGERIAVALEFSADLPGQWFDLSGRVYLVGTPMLDAQRSQLWIADLAYDASTNIVLIDVAEWMLHHEIRRRVQALLVFSFAEQLGQYRDRVNEAIADYQIVDRVRLRGRLDDVQVVSLTITDPAIVAVVELRGAAKLELTP